MNRNLDLSVKLRRVAAPLLLLLSFASWAVGQDGDPFGADSDFPSIRELKQLSIEELAQLSVTSVSKREEPLSQAASAIQVITGEDIRRSGAMTLADALRLAPNLSVHQIRSYAWGISARGFNALFANKLLVMIDGRSVYTPLFAGVFWDAQNVLLEDIDRVEVISGPGGSLWGANAVNGVINVITKDAEETQGLYVSGAAGSFLQDFGAARYGGRAGENLFYRVYGQRFDFNGTREPDGGEADDAWHMTQGGFRVDYEPYKLGHLTLQGDLYEGTEYNTDSAGDSSLDGQNLLARWEEEYPDESEVQVQVYFDRTWREDIPSTVTDELLTYDVDFQHTLPAKGRHSFVWGAGYRVMWADTPTSTNFVGLLPQRRTMRLFSGFVQDEIAWVPERLNLTLGTKVEHNDFSGFEVQPNVRLSWNINERNTLWSAISRAVRTPSRIDVDYFIPKVPPYSGQRVAGGPDFDSEELIAYEIGYRAQPTEKLTFSLATFYHDYDRLYSVELEDPAPPLDVYTIQNGTNGHSWGAELSGTYQVLDRWRIRGGYTYFDKDLWSHRGHDVSGSVLASLGNDAHNQVVLQSMLDLPGNVAFDVTGRWVDSLPDPPVPSYLVFDVRLAWQVENLELSVVGRNLGDNQHPEFSHAQQVPHSIYAKATLRY